MTSHFGVVGGGITGLTAAYRLQGGGHRVTLLEASSRTGGKIRSGVVGGIEVDDGPDAFLPRNPAPVELMEELGLTDTRGPAVFGAYIWHRGAMRKLPDGSPFGIPRSPAAAHQVGLLSALGAFRAGLETLSRAPLSGPDVSIGSFVRSRFGDEVATNMVDPLLAGVRGGTAGDISLAAAAPEIDSLARGNRSLLVALRAMPLQPPRFVAPSEGMGRIPELLAAGIDDVRTDTPIDAMEMDGGRVVLRSGSGSLDFDGVILTCPPYVAADLVASLDPEAASDLRAIAFASLVVVTLVYPPGSFEAPRDGSGLLVPTGSDLAISACTWYSHKWPHVCNDGRQVVRCVIGRAGDDPRLRSDDGELAALVHRDLRTTIDVSAPFLSQRVTRWPEAIPQYSVGHIDLVSSIEERLRKAGPILVAGAGYRGSGIPDCIAQASAAAETLPGLSKTLRR